MTDQTFWWLLAFWTFSNIVSTMPSPDVMKDAFEFSKGKSVLYKWGYDLLHFAAGNAGRIFPQVRFLQNGKPNGGPQ